MRFDDVILKIYISGEKDADGFPTSDIEAEFPLSASKLAVSTSDRIASEKEGVRISLKIAVDIDDFNESIKIVDGKKRRPSIAIFDDSEYKIFDTFENLKTHQMELLLMEVE